jgi:hypothetical protein
LSIARTYSGRAAPATLKPPLPSGFIPGGANAAWIFIRADRTTKDGPKENDDTDASKKLARTAARVDFMADIGRRKCLEVVPP